MNERVQKSSSSFLQTSANLRSSLGPFEFNWLEHTNNLTDLNEAKANPRLYPTKHSLINPFISSPSAHYPTWLYCLDPQLIIFRSKHTSTQLHPLPNNPRLVHLLHPLKFIPFTFLIDIDRIYFESRTIKRTVETISRMPREIQIKIFICRLQVVSKMYEAYN